MIGAFCLFKTPNAYRMLPFQNAKCLVHFAFSKRQALAYTNTGNENGLTISIT